MTEDEIINSPVFKALNAMIDKYAGELECWCSALKGKVKSDEKGIINTRTSYEDKNHGKRELPMGIYEIDAIIDAAKMIIKYEELILDIQRTKLRLLNDYDFTHGDNKLQSIVFQVPHIVPDGMESEG